MTKYCVDDLPRVGLTCCRSYGDPRPARSPRRAKPITAGDTPGVAKVAEAARIPRSTAYRYFVSTGRASRRGTPGDRSRVRPSRPCAGSRRRTCGRCCRVRHQPRAGGSRSNVRCCASRWKKCRRAAAPPGPRHSVVHRGARANGRVDRRRGRPPAGVGTPRRMWHRDPRLAERRRPRSPPQKSAPSTNGWSMPSSRRPSRSPTGLTTRCIIGQ